MNFILMSVLVVFALAILLAIFLFFDDRKNVRIRAEEDRQKALQQRAEKDTKSD